MYPEYITIRASRFIGVKPWELEEHPDGVYWKLWALECEKADTLVESAMMQEAQSKVKGRTKR